MSFKTLLSGSAVYLLANLASAALPFALLPVLTRYLGPSEYGVVALFQALVAGLGAVVGFGVVGAIARKYYDADVGVHQLRDFIGTCIQITLFSGLLALLGVVVLQKQISELLAMDIRWALLAVVVATATALVQIRLSQWQVKGEAIRYAALQTFQSGLAVTLSLIAVVAWVMGAEGRIVAIALAICASALAAVWLLHRDGLVRLKLWNVSYVKEALAFGLPLMPHTLGGFLLFSADRVVINANLGLSDAGVYAVASQLVAVMSMVFGAVNNAYVPWLFQRLKDDIPSEKLEIVRYTYIWFGLIFLSVVCAFVTGPFLVVLIAGEAFVEAGHVIGWLALSQAFVGMYLMVTNYIFFSKKTIFLSFATLLSGVINLVLLPFMVVSFGLKGAAGAACIANGLQFVVTWWLAARLHPMPWFGVRVEK
jgi:O-antigen/teichoic acid export membrane protein